MAFLDVVLCASVSSMILYQPWALMIDQMVLLGSID
jgi:hypothetical protein